MPGFRKMRVVLIIVNILENLVLFLLIYSWFLARRVLKLTSGVSYSLFRPKGSQLVFLHSMRNKLGFFCIVYMCSLGVVFHVTEYLLLQFQIEHITRLTVTESCKEDTTSQSFNFTIKIQHSLHLIWIYYLSKHNGCDPVFFSVKTEISWSLKGLGTLSKLQQKATREPSLTLGLLNHLPWTELDCITAVSCWSWTISQFESHLYILIPLAILVS